MYLRKKVIDTQNPPVYSQGVKIKAVNMDALIPPHINTNERELNGAHHKQGRPGKQGRPVKQATSLSSLKLNQGAMEHIISTFKTPTPITSTPVNTTNHVHRQLNMGTKEGEGLPSDHVPYATSSALSALTPLPLKIILSNQ